MTASRGGGAFRDTSAEAICAWTTCWCFNMKNQQKGGVSHTPQRQRAMHDGADVAELLGRAIAGSHWSVAKDSKA